MRKKELKSQIEVLEQRLLALQQRVHEIEHNGIARRVKAAEDRVDIVHKRVNGIDHVLRLLEVDRQADAVEPVLAEDKECENCKHWLPDASVTKGKAVVGNCVVDSRYSITGALFSCSKWEQKQ